MGTDADDRVCVLAPPVNRKQELIYNILSTLGSPLAEEDIGRASGRSGYEMLCVGNGRLGFQYRPGFEAPEGSIYLAVPQAAIHLAMEAEASCNIAYKEGFDTGERLGLKEGKDLLRRLGAGEISTTDFEARESIYKTKGDGPLYRVWPG